MFYRLYLLSSPSFFFVYLSIYLSIYLYVLKNADCNKNLAVDIFSNS